MTDREETMPSRLTGLAVLLGGLALGPHLHAQDAGDAEAGEKVFRKCKACHVVDDTKNRVGPHLNGVVGREVGAVEGYKYSDAMVEWGAEKVWDAETLDAYLADPRGVVDGTKMVFAGLKDAADRADLVAYLESVPAAE